MNCDKDKDKERSSNIDEKNIGENTNSNRTQPENTNFKGLCVNCTKRDTCEIKKPKEGVWRCDEYC